MTKTEELYILSMQLFLKDLELEMEQIDSSINYLGVKIPMLQKERKLTIDSKLVTQDRIDEANKILKEYIENIDKENG